LKAGQSQLNGIEIHQIFFRLNDSLLKADSAAHNTFESWPGPIFPVFKNFLQIKKPFALNG
jgi:hypothetical protein